MKGVRNKTETHLSFALKNIKFSLQELELVASDIFTKCLGGEAAHSDLKIFFETDPEEKGLKFLKINKIYILDY